MSALGAVGAALAACAPKVVKETVIVEKLVKETVIVAGTPKVIEKVVTATPAPVEKKEVELFWHMSEYEGWANDIIKPLFEEKNPDLELTWTFVNDPENETVLTNRMAAGDPPDMFIIIGGPAISWLKEDWLADLSRFPELKENLSHYPQDAWSFCRSARQVAGYPKEGIWGVPSMTVLSGVFYDKNKFEEWGVKPVATYDEWWDLLETLEKVPELVIVRCVKAPPSGLIGSRVGVLLQPSLDPLPKRLLSQCPLHIVSEIAETNQLSFNESPHEARNRLAPGSTYLIDQSSIVVRYLETNSTGHLFHTT